MIILCSCLQILLVPYYLQYKVQIHQHGIGKPSSLVLFYIFRVIAHDPLSRHSLLSHHNEQRLILQTCYTRSHHQIIIHAILSVQSTLDPTSLLHLVRAHCPRPKSNIKSLEKTLGKELNGPFLCPNGTLLISQLFHLLPHIILFVSQSKQRLSCSLEWMP